MLETIQLRQLDTWLNERIFLFHLFTHISRKRIPAFNLNYTYLITWMIHIIDLGCCVFKVPQTDFWSYALFSNQRSMLKKKSHFYQSKQSNARHKHPLPSRLQAHFSVCLSWNFCTNNNNDGNRLHLLLRTIMWTNFNESMIPTSIWL